MLSKLARYLGTFAIVALTGAHNALAADPAYCEGYANIAVGQYHTAVAKGIPGIGLPQWHADRNAHYWWCTLPIVSRQAADAEVAARQQTISQYP